MVSATKFAFAFKANPAISAGEWELKGWELQLRRTERFAPHQDLNYVYLNLVFY
jgi:hypothetical protein